MLILTPMGEGEVAAYEAGNYFGELAMLTGQPRKAWVMAASYCVCSVLPYSVIEMLSQEHPASFTRLVQSMVRSFGLEASMTWEEVTRRMFAKFGFESVEEAFDWCCSLDVTEGCQEELTAKGFDAALRYLRVPELDRRVYH